MKAFLFHKFNNIYKDNTLDYCFTILYRGTLGEKAIQTVSIIQSHGRVNEGFKSLGGWIQERKIVKTL